MPPRRDKFHNKRNKGSKFQNKGSKFQNREPQKKKEYRHQDQLTEDEVGITEFISNLEGFSGIIKARFSDFQVNEINLEAMVAKLTDTGAPKDFVPKVEKSDYINVTVSPLKNLPQEKWDALKSLVSSENPEPVKLEADNLSKEERTEIHKFIINHFRQKIVASTVIIEDKKFMQFKKFKKSGKLVYDLKKCIYSKYFFFVEKTDERFQWPDDKGEYVHFLVYKEAIDTMDACLKISDCLKMSPTHFTYAGVKDKRAKTTQWFCVHKVAPWKLMKKTRPLRNIKIGNFTFKDEPLKLGQLQGNKFRIALRNVTGHDDLINKSMKHVKENGFINFYGLQRFGNDKEVPTYDIGINLLLGKWKEVNFYRLALVGIILSFKCCFRLCS